MKKVPKFPKYPNADGYDPDVPNEVWFWYHRFQIWRDHPDVVIEEPAHIKRKRLERENKTNETK
jgi:hypothetical protein